MILPTSLLAVSLDHLITKTYDLAPAILSNRVYHSLPAPMRQPSWPLSPYADQAYCYLLYLLYPLVESPSLIAILEVSAS